MTDRLLYEFALTPDVFDSAVLRDGVAGTVLATLLRGGLAHGVVANLADGAWRRRIGERLSGLPQEFPTNVKSDIEMLLVALMDRQRIVKYPKAQTKLLTLDREWLDLAMHTHAAHPFYGVVLGDALLSGCGLHDDALLGFSQSLGSARWTGMRRTLAVMQTEAGYRAALAPLLRHARRVLLVDPNFAPGRSKWLRTVRLVAELLGQRGYEPLAGVIQIHARDPEGRIGLSPSDCLSQWKQDLRPLTTVGARHTFRVFLWRDRRTATGIGASKGSGRFHDRFVLTNQCGVSVPGGLDCLDPQDADVTHWSVLDVEDWQLEWERYYNGAGPFELLGELTVAP